MPLIIEGGRIPPLWAGRTSPRRGGVRDDPAGRDCVRVAFINNMPDPALEDTELQFCDLLDAASGELRVMLKLYSIDEVPRTDRGERHLSDFYTSVKDLWDDRFDALIMTGTEPRSANLEEEPYWQTLGRVLDWAESNTASTILSCLAAHAGVLYSDGIGRHRLSDKQFGVFEFEKSASHLITRGCDLVRFPHSRWNEVRAEDLANSGYQLLTQSVDGGVDCFVKKKKRSLFVHFQGHPEYGAQTLLKEYRRDIKHFLRNERETYPTMPHGYFDASSLSLLNEFRNAAVACRREEVIESFPESIAQSLQKTWNSSAVRIYRNWFQYLISREAKINLFSGVDALCAQPLRKPSAVR